MKTKEEKYIVNLANQLIGQCNITPESVMTSSVSSSDRVTFMSLGSSKDFVCKLRLTGKLLAINTLVERMNPSTLGKIVATAISCHNGSSDFRSTPFQDVYVGELFSRTTEGINSLRKVASAVIVATMYDILATQWWIGNVEEGELKTFDSEIPFQTKAGMRVFVRSVRMHDLLQ